MIEVKFGKVFDGLREAELLDEHIAWKEESPILDRLGDPDVALRFLRSHLRGSYLFARFVVPSFAAAVFQRLTFGRPPADRLGRVLSVLMDVIRGELCNNNVFARPGECHSHFWDLLECYRTAGGDMNEVEAFLESADKDPEKAIATGRLWSERSRHYAQAILACCRNPLALFILMPANEALAPALYAKALASLSTDARFDPFRTFMRRHVELDQGDHGPAALEWLDLHIERSHVGQDQRKLRREVVASLKLVIDAY